MQLRFNDASSGLQTFAKMPYHFPVWFPSNKDGFAINNKTVKTGEEWIAEARRIALALGITQCCMTIGDVRVGTLPAIKFHFADELDMLRFMVAALGDKEGKFERKIHGASSRDTSIKVEGIKAFLQAHEINGKIRRSTPYIIEVTTFSRYDDLALFYHLQDGGYKMHVSPALLAYERERKL